MPSSKTKYREAKNPQVSANQLSQYLSAGPTARKRIVRDARFQSTAIVTRYKAAREAITSCLCDDTRSPMKVAEYQHKLNVRLSEPGISSWVSEDLELSIKAIERYAATAGQTILSKVLCKPIHGTVPPLLIEGLRVKVTPDVTLHKADGTVGVLVTAIAKGEKSDKARAEQCRTSALLAWLFAQKHLNSLGEVSRPLCLSYDVFGGIALSSTANYKTKIQNIHDACEEIMERWNKVTPPEDFDG